MLGTVGLLTVAGGVTELLKPWNGLIVDSGFTELSW